MTRRGTPLPWSLRDAIRQRVAAGESRRSGTPGPWESPSIPAANTRGVVCDKPMEPFCYVLTIKDRKPEHGANSHLRPREAWTTPRSPPCVPLLSRNYADRRRASTATWLVAWCDREQIWRRKSDREYNTWHDLCLPKCIPWTDSQLADALLATTMLTTPNPTSGLHIASTATSSSW